MKTFAVWSGPENRWDSLEASAVEEQWVNSNDSSRMAGHRKRYTSQYVWCPGKLSIGLMAFLTQTTQCDEKVKCQQSQFKKAAFFQSKFGQRFWLISEYALLEYLSDTTLFNNGKNRTYWGILLFH